MVQREGFRNNPYRLPALAYFILMATMLARFWLLMLLGIMDAEIRRDNDEKYWYWPLVSAWTECMGCLPIWTFFLFPALIANVQEALRAHGYDI